MAQGEANLLPETECGFHASMRRELEKLQAVFAAATESADLIRQIVAGRKSTMETR